MAGEPAEKPFRGPGATNPATGVRNGFADVLDGPRETMSCVGAVGVLRAFAAKRQGAPVKAWGVGGFPESGPQPDVGEPPPTRNPLGGRSASRSVVQFPIGERLRLNDFTR